MKISLSLSVFLILIPVILIAQPRFEFGQGTITKKDSTLIKCFVEIVPAYGARVTYKMSQDGIERSLKSSEIKSIQTPYKYLENITLDNQERLMTRAADGKVKLFIYINANPGKAQRDAGSTGTVRYDLPPTIIYALEKDKNYTAIERKNFKERLPKLLNDQPTMIGWLDENDYKFEDIEKIVDSYNRISEIQALKRQITVKVVDAETQRPVKDARVVIRGTNIETSTNILGFIQLTIDTQDTLLIVHPEYELGQIKVPNANNFQISLTKATIKKE